MTLGIGFELPPPQKTCQYDSNGGVCSIDHFAMYTKICAASLFLMLNLILQLERCQ